MTALWLLDKKLMDGNKRHLIQALSCGINHFIYTQIQGRSSTAFSNLSRMIESKKQTRLFSFFPSVLSQQLIQPMFGIWQPQTCMPQLCLDAIVLEGGGEKGSDVYSTYPMASGHDGAFCIKREGGDEKCHRRIWHTSSLNNRKERDRGREWRCFFCCGLS